ncbi:MAG: hypothetical protein M1401_01025 [Chloroflexi bacterium]|nr:hypothetical protein [Chloroflexota bacterium]MCL5107459.1 hypothetical protein [Chloroflexota bacterium]
MRPKTLLALLGVLVVVAALAFSPLQNIFARQLARGPQAAVQPLPAETVLPVATPTTAARSTPAPTPTPTPEPTATVAPTATPAIVRSALAGRTWLTIYGRGFEAGPILGRLANYKNLDDMAAEVGPWMQEIKKYNGGKEVVPVIHLIYGMATPCEADGNCLFYLDSAGVDVVETYIKPAAARGWQVILDTQIGKSTPELEVERMIKKGYLDYPNVHVAFDPEFHVYPGEDLPGIPIGQVDSSDINAAQKMLNDLVAEKHLAAKKVLIVHQFGDPEVNDGNPFMITDKKATKTYDNVDLVFDADGFGGPVSKVHKYDLMTNAEVYPFIKFRGIKLFFFNPHEERHHGDTPVMTWAQVFGKEDVGTNVRMNTMPDVVVIA